MTCAPLEAVNNTLSKFSCVFGAGARFEASANRSMAFLHIFNVIFKEPMIYLRFHRSIQSQRVIEASHGTPILSLTEVVYVRDFYTAGYCRTVAV